MIRGPITSGKCVQPDAARRARTAAVIAGVLLLSSCVASAWAEPRPLPASLVSAHDSLLFVATADSGALPTGMTLSLRRGRKTVATGVVVRTLGPRFAEARLTSGSLARERRLSRLKLFGEDPPARRTVSLRVGLPGGARTNLLFACPTPAVTPRLGPAWYAPDSLDPGGRRWLKRVAPLEGASTGAAIAPDTLTVQFFAEATDQEIALERGELDVAVFWPGEVSARVRAEPRWWNDLRGVRSRGVVACLAAGADSSGPPPADMAALNRDAFGGDLLPWSDLEPASPDPAPSPSGPPARYAVDPALPGARLMERVLARAVKNGGPRTLRIAYLDVPVAARDAVQASWRTRDVAPVFAVRCPILATPDAREIVRAVGANAFADLVGCP